MTEDDTFDKLRRTPLYEMARLMRLDGRGSIRMPDEFFKDNGWESWDNYFDACELEYQLKTRDND